MSMIGNYFRISPENVQKAESGELDLESFIYDEDNQMNEEIALDIDKSWHAIYFTLTGEIDTEAYDNAEGIGLLMGSRPIGEDLDLGYGPGGLIDAQQVKMLSAKLDSITRESFRAAFNLQEMLENQVYPCIDGEDEEEFFEYVWSNIPAMQEFFQKAAQAGDCIIFYIS